MTRLFIFAGFVIAFATAAAVVSNPLRGEGVEVPASEAATILGGQCGAYQKMTGGACTDSVSDSCTPMTSVCNGLCPYSCSPTLTYSGTGSFTGQLLTPSSCNGSTQPTCTVTLCSVMGAPVGCCQCVGGSEVACGPGPVDLNSEGCSNTD
jgi:hypothetical protein